MTNTTSPSSFYNQSAVIYTEDNPAAPADTPVTADNTNAPSSFYKGTGEGSGGTQIFASGVPTFTPIAHTWLTGLLGNTWHYAQPAFTDLSGTISASSLPTPTTSSLGGIEAVNAVAHQWVSYIDTSGVPHLTQPAFTDISGTATASQLPTPTTSALGGVQAINAVTHQWINSINPSGVPQLSQPAFTDLSGNITTSQMNSGTGASSATFWRGDGTWVTPSGSGTITGINGITSGAVTIAANDGDAVSASGSTVTFGGPAGFRNKFRNPNFLIAQRGTSGTVTSGSTAYTIDGWQIVSTGATTSWAAIGNTSGGVWGAIRITGASGLTACTLKQRIESYVARQLLGVSGAQPITVQFFINNQSGSSLTAQIAGGYASAQDNFSTVTSDLAATNLQTIASGSVGTVAYTFTPSTSMSNGYEFQLLLGGALNNTNHIDVALADVRATPGGTTGLNSNPPPPEQHPIGLALVMCQRYYRQTVPGGQFSEPTFSGYNQTGSGIGVTVPFPVPMRAAPTITSAGTFSTSNVGTPSFYAYDGYSYYATAAITSTGPGYFLCNSSGFLKFSAEL